MKRLLFPALAVLAACGLAACGGEPAPVQKEGTLTVRTENTAIPPRGRQVIYPQDSGEILHNPGMGWVVLEEPLYPGRATLGWQGDFPEADSVSLSLSWKDVEPADGVYDWSEVDKAVEYWTALGKKINMRLVTDLNTIGYPVGGAPDWVGDEYGVPYTLEPVSGPLCGRLYDLANPEFLRLHDRFVSVFAGRYRDNPEIDVIEIRAYGWFGEWHSSGNFQSVEERVATLRHFLDVWKEAWGDKLFVVSASYEYNQQYVPSSVLDTLQSSMDEFAYVSAFDYAVRQGMTFRRDGIGAALHYWDEKLLTDTFKMNHRLPILGEHFGGYHVFLNRENGYDLMDFMSEALYKLHCNYLTAIGWVGEPFAEVAAPAEEGGSPDILDFGNRFLGFRLVPHRLEFDAAAAPGGTLTLSQLWSNTAAGRAWTTAPLKVYLTDADGAEVWSGVDDTFDPVVFTGGDLHWHESAFPLPGDLEPGEYDLRFALVDAENGRPAYKLPIANRDEEGRYWIGRVRVEPNAQPAETAALPLGESALRPAAECIPAEDEALGKVWRAGKPGERYDGDVLESTLPLEADAVYLLRFRYRSEIEPEAIDITSDERYSVEMRRADGTAIGRYLWRDVSAEPSERTLLFRTEGEGCRLVWGLRDAYPLRLGGVTLRKLDGESVAEHFEGEDSFLSALDPSGQSGVVPDEDNDGSNEFFISTVGSRPENPRTVQARSLPLRPNTAYYLSFQTKGRATGIGNYYFVDLRDGTESRSLCNWFEREDFGPVNKSFHFVTGSAAEQYLEFGCYREGSFTVDDLLLVEDTQGTTVTAEQVPEEPRNEVRRPVFSGYPVIADFEGSSFHSSMLYPGVAHQGRFTLREGEVISGQSSVLGKVWAERDGWVNFMTSYPDRLPMETGRDYEVRFRYRVLEPAAAEGEGAWFQLCGGDGAAVLQYPLEGRVGEVREFSQTVRPESDGSTLRWSLYRSGSIVIDDVEIREAAE